MELKQISTLFQNEIMRGVYGILMVLSMTFVSCSDNKEEQLPVGVVREGETYDYGQLKYRINRSDEGGLNAGLIGIADSASVRNFIVPDEVVLLGNRLPVTAIMSHAFYGNKNIQSIKLGKNIAEINNGAFAYSNLENIELNQGLRTICDSAFYMTGLGGVLSLDSIYLGKYSFAGCVISEVSLPVCMDSIPEWCFSNCVLNRLEIPANIRRIGKGAFNNCSLYGVDVIIPDNVISIGDEAFEGLLASKLEIGSGCRYIGEWAFKGCAVKKVVIRSDSLTLGYRCFNWNYIEEVIGSENIVELGWGAFLWSMSLKSIRLSNKLKRMEESCFEECTELKEVYFSGDEINISRRCFARCKKLKDVHVDGRIRGLGGACFAGCKSLRSISGLDEIEYIGAGAFSGSGIDSLIVESTRFKNVEARVFDNCENLKFVSLPANVSHMEHSDLTFSLRHIVLHSPDPIGPDRDFYECQSPRIQCNPADVVVTVPQRAVERYKQSPYWKYFNIQSIE